MAKKKPKRSVPATRKKRSPAGVPPQIKPDVTHAMLADFSGYVYLGQEDTETCAKEYGWQLQNMVNSDDGNTCCAVVTRRASKQAVIAWRGTEPEKLRQWIIDLKAVRVPLGCGRVHKGFLDSVESVWSPLKTEVEKLIDNGYDIHSTGHSKGGGESLVSTWLIYERLPYPRLKPPVVFGCPRVFDPLLASRFDVAFPGTVRWVNNNDIVTRIPLSSINTGWLRTLVLKACPWAWLLPAGFRHVGQLIYVSADGETIRNPGRWQLFKDRIRGRKLAGKKFLIDGSLDHNINHYCDATKADTGIVVC